MSKLYVDEIASKTGGADALTIDSSGRISQPALPSTYFQGGQNGDVTYNNADVFGASDFGTPAFRTDGVNGSFTQGGITYNPTTGRFVVPVNGVYKVYLQAYLNQNSSCRISIYKNGVQVGLGHIPSGPGIVIANTILELTTSDTLEFRHESGSDRTIYSGVNHTFGYIHFLG